MTISAKHLALIPVVLTMWPVMAVACDATEVCNDTSSSLVGEYISEGVRVSWSTDAEPWSWASNLSDSYVLSRYNCQSPSTCSTTVATLYTRGGCGSTQSYTYTDNPPTPWAQWTYRVTLVVDLSPACSNDVSPE